jgi:ubiquinone/menaquinone biosynthesis C-methylase UbiE
MNINSSTFNIDSKNYLQYRPKYPPELYQFINSICKNHDVAWDTACGNGQVSIDISPYFSRIEASDIHENQIENAYKHDKIYYSIQKSEHTNYPSNYFDLICIAQALHWLNLNEFFSEAKRVLKKNGLFFCWGYVFFKIDNEIDEVINHNLLKEIDQFWSDKNRLLHNEYKGISFPFERIKIPKIDMTEKWNLHQLLEYLNTWSAVKLYNKNKSDNIINNIKIILSKYWKEDELKEIKMDFFVYGRINI